MPLIVTTPKSKEGPTGYFASPLTLGVKRPRPTSPDRLEPPPDVTNKRRRLDVQVQEPINVSSRLMLNLKTTEEDDGPDTLAPPLSPLPEAASLTLKVQTPISTQNKLK